MSHRTLTRTLAGVGAGVALAIAIPLAASAHVTISPNQAAAGSDAYVTFRVPNESASASTTSLDIQLPTDTPFTDVGYQPVAGWTGNVTTGTLPAPVEVGGNTITEAPTHLVLTANPGTGIAPGQFQTFVVSLGAVPDVGSIVLPVTQTYSDGTVAEWSATPAEVAADDTKEPAPVLYVNDAPPAAGHDAAAAPTVTAEPTASAASSDPGAGVALGLSITALVVAAAGALLAALALGRRRKTT
ncbi:YcnI family protein [Microbacterium sp. X-17]|uniref:YcnI family copper-binding membrane protein n=1 Tax=Microbacterium sp. X-17 TaxID=3144404 RepID=UPI0031F4E9CC